MTTSTLLGKNRVTESEIFAVPAVPYTRSFHPIHHKDMIVTVKDAIASAGLAITKQEYVLGGKNGEKVFGVYDLSNGNSELCWSVGIRNSMDKSFALSFTCGTRVFVCENLCFSGDFITLSRRHTSGLDMEELAFLAFRAIRRMIPQLQSFQSWHESLRNYPLSDFEMRMLLHEMIYQGVFPASKFHHFCDLYQNVYTENNMWHLHESVTHLHKDSNLMHLPQKNKLLNQIINQYISSLDTAQPSALGEFYNQRALLRR